MIVVLMGFMGAGKTTVGCMLAEKLGLPFVDIDILVEQRSGRRVRDIFSEDGETEFRRLEHETIVEVLSGTDAVVALGGGAVEHPGTREALRSATAVHLEVSYEEALLRIGNDDLRPMMARPDIRDVYDRRLGAYSEAADFSVKTDLRRPEEVVEELAGNLSLGKPSG
ncbi:MAG: shikimate kinase [Acidimicrobiales bacterium]